MGGGALVIPQYTGKGQAVCAVSKRSCPEQGGGKDLTPEVVLSFTYVPWYVDTHACMCMNTHNTASQCDFASQPLHGTTEVKD